MYEYLCSVVKNYISFITQCLWVAVSHYMEIDGTRPVFTNIQIALFVTYADEMIFCLKLPFSDCIKVYLNWRGLVLSKCTFI